MALIKCESCEKSVSDKATVCPHCGQSIHSSIDNVRLATEISLCPECGHELLKEKDACPNCGYPIHPHNNVSQNTSQIIHKPFRSSKKLIALSALGILLIGAILAYGIVYVGWLRSDAANIVVNDIRALGEITIESSQPIKDIYAKYDALSDKEKSSILNFSTLEAAKQTYTELLCADINERIEKECANVTAESYSKLAELMKDYKGLDENAKTQIVNIKQLEESFEKSKPLKAKKVTNEIISGANGSIDLSKIQLEVYSDIMTQQQIKDCLIEIGRWDAIAKAENHLKAILKNPSSYKKYSSSTYTPSLQSDGSYRVKVKLEYGATNSFNAMIRDEVELYVYYKLNTSKLSVNYTDVEFTAYYQWKFAQ